MFDPLSMRLRRRSLLLSAGALAGSTLLGRESRRVVAQPAFTDYPFRLGIASGDPSPDSVVLWTRLAPNPLIPVSMPPVNVPVRWQVAADEQMKRIVAKGEAIATPEYGHSVHVVVNGLESDRWYWYQFKAGNEVSPVGRTRTTPALNASPQQLTFAFVSCQNYEHGYFTAYRYLAQEDLNFVLHLGDYIYEYAAKPDSDNPRQHVGPEATDLDTYRLRHALYKTDPDLQAAHASFPFICTWDDHEVDNDYANDKSQDFDEIEPFLRRRAAAYQAYFEHLPLRPSSLPQGSSLQLYRRFTIGDLAQFSVLDTRQYRSDQACADNERGGGQIINCSERLDPNRSLLGNQQESWLLQGLGQSQTIWNVVAQQTLVAQLSRQINSQTLYWSDGWDGYPVSRKRILEFIEQRRIANPIFVGGDVHSFWVSDLKRDFENPDSPVVASEFVCTSLSANGIPYEQIVPVLSQNPHIKFFESRLRGYVKCIVDRQQWLSHLQVVGTVKLPEASLKTLATYRVENGQVGAEQV